MPYSSSYVALGLAGRGVAWTGKTYVVPAAGVSVALPGFIGVDKDRLGRSEGRWGEFCPRCFHLRSLSGVCDCD